MSVCVCVYVCWGLSAVVETPPSDERAKKQQIRHAMCNRFFAVDVVVVVVWIVCTFAARE